MLEQCSNALDEGLEYVAARIFDAVDYERTIYGRAALIRITHPNAIKGTPPLWIYKNTITAGEHTVPPGYEVEVIDGWIKLTKSSVA